MKKLASLIKLMFIALLLSSCCDEVYEVTDLIESMDDTAKDMTNGEITRDDGCDKVYQSAIRVLEIAKNAQDALNECQSKNFEEKIMQKRNFLETDEQRDRRVNEAKKRCDHLVPASKKLYSFQVGFKNLKTLIKNMCFNIKEEVIDAKLVGAIILNGFDDTIEGKKIRVYSTKEYKDFVEKQLAPSCFDFSNSMFGLKQEEKQRYYILEEGKIKNDIRSTGV